MDQSVLDSLEKRYQLILDSPNGEINVFLILNKSEESNKFSKSSPRNVLPNDKTFKKNNYYDLESLYHNYNNIWEFIYLEILYININFLVLKNKFIWK